ncbi:MAG: XRE family transcriptional regulator [Planctomycetes bacterium]|nr:XRE family transcriptional regulator [Planctomycetota bacterium]
MNEQIRQIGARIREIREILDITPEEAAACVGVTPDRYLSYEDATVDIPIGVLYGLAAEFRVDPTELLTGEPPRMDDYTIVRMGQGIKVDRYAGYSFSSLAFNYKNRDMEPMIVTLSHAEVAQLVVHAGQEFNYVLEGMVMVVLRDKEFTLEPGDSIYFNPAIPHGQRAVTPTARFLTVINE